MNRFQFVADHRDAFEVKRLGEIVHVARSSFYAWLAAAPVRAVRASADTALAERIRKIHQADRAQGVPRITAELNDGADPAARVNHKRVARIMRQEQIAGLRLRRRFLAHRGAFECDGRGSADLLLQNSHSDRGGICHASGPR